MRKLIILLLGALLLCAPAFAEEATIPQFDVYIDDDKLEFQNADYPLLLYKNITYFPMTYDYVHWLNLTSSWDGSFYIAYNRDTTSYQPTGPLSWQSNPTVCEVKKAEYPIYVNGKVVDNSKEEYPLLTFRDITYFPLTWDYATDEFELALSWDGNLHIEKQYNYSSEYFDTVGDKAYFNFEPMIESINADGEIEYSSSGHYYGAYFDCTNKTFALSDSTFEERDLVGETATEAKLENGILKYGDETVADVSEYLAENNLSDTEFSDYAEPYIRPIKYSLGSMELVLVQVYHDSLVRPYAYRRVCLFLVNNDDITMISDDEDVWAEKISEIADKYYVSFSYGNSFVRQGYKLVCIDKNGNITPYDDADHMSTELIGEIDGKPLVYAVWQYESKVVSLVNDGFFTLESDNTLKRYYNYVYNSGSFVCNNVLYIVRPNKGTLLDTSTGIEYSYTEFENQYK